MHCNIIIHYKQTKCTFSKLKIQILILKVWFCQFIFYNYEWYLICITKNFTVILWVSKEITVSLSKFETTSSVKTDETWFCNFVHTEFLIYRSQELCWLWPNNLRGRHSGAFRHIVTANRKYWRNPHTFSVRISDRPAGIRTGTFQVKAWSFTDNTPRPPVHWHSVIISRDWLRLYSAVLISQLIPHYY